MSACDTDLLQPLSHEALVRHAEEADVEIGNRFMLDTSIRNTQYNKILYLPGTLIFYVDILDYYLYRETTIYFWLFGIPGARAY
jgi:hypothetical protein